MTTNKSITPNSRKVVSAMEFSTSYSFQKQVRDLEITGDLYIDDLQSDTINLFNCKLENLSITRPLKSLTITACEFNQIEIGNDIDFLSINKIDCENSYISIDHSKIKKLQLLDNPNLSEIDAGSLNTIEIESIHCAKSRIKSIYLFCNSKSVLFGYDNIIEEIKLDGDLKRVHFIYRQHYGKRHQPSSYGTIAYSNTGNNNGLFFENTIIKRLQIGYCSNNTTIEISQLNCHLILLEKNSFGGDGTFSISDSNEIKKILFTNCTLKQLNIFNSDFRNTSFVTYQSVISKVNWQFVKWSKKLTNYSEEDIDLSYRAETLRVLKVNADRQQDKYNGVLFSSLENEALRQTIRQENKSYGDRFILWLNQISNNHGMNPWQGVFFTALVCALFFFPGLLFLNNSYWNWGWAGWSDFWIVAGKTTELYAKALYAAHSFDYLKDFQPKGIVFILDLIGRIFVAYGYYQTIVAFRKFNRK